MNRNGQQKSRLQMTKQNCGTCRHYAEVDARAEMIDPACIYMVCTWRPKQPFWVPAPFRSESPFGPRLDSIRKPGDGEKCETWERKPSARKPRSSEGRDGA